MNLNSKSYIIVSLQTQQRSKYLLFVVEAVVFISVEVADDVLAVTFAELANSIVSKVIKASSVRLNTRQVS